MITLNDINTYNSIITELNDFCNRWAKENLKDWQHYDSWTLKNSMVYIYYSYADFENNTDLTTSFGVIKIPVEEILKLQEYEN